MDALDHGDESDDKPMPTDMLEMFCDGSQYHTHINRREARYKIRDCIKPGQLEQKRSVKIYAKHG